MKNYFCYNERRIIAPVIKISVAALIAFAVIFCAGCAVSRDKSSETSAPAQTSAETTPITGQVAIKPYVETDTGGTVTAEETTAGVTAPETDTETQPPDEIKLPKGSLSINTAPSRQREKREGGRSCSFVAVGDSIVHTGIWLEAKQYGKNTPREYCFAPLFDDIADMIKSADISFINQETLMGGAELGYSNYPTFNSPQDLGLDLVDLGFDIVNIANNHMADKGAIGLENTIDFWNAQPVTLIGGYKNYDDYKNIRTVTRGGVTIALLSYTFSTNGIPLPKNTELYVPYIDYAKITAQVAAAKKLGDLVFVSVHWGVENSFTPSSEQTALAQYMADLGVDVILGHHPHVVQTITWLRGKNGNDTLCIYSLSNILSLMASPINMVGGVMTFSINEGDDGWFIADPMFVPTVFFYAKNFYGQHIYLMKDYSDALAAKMGTQNYGYTASLDKLRGYVTNNIDAAFLPEYIK